MADNTEATLFTNLEFLVGKVVSAGAAYMPPYPHSFALPMQTNLAAALPVRTTFQNQSSLERLKRHERAEMHKQLTGLCGDLIKYCKSGRWAKNDLDTLRSYSRLLKGRPAKEREDDPATPDIDESRQGRSSAQTSYPSRTEHFANFVETLRAKGDFDPSEERFKLSTLDALVAALRAANSEVSAAAIAKAQARAALDALLYTNADNLVDAANSAKYYLSSSFKEIYQSVKHMRFTKPRRLTKL